MDVAVIWINTWSMWVRKNDSSSGLSYNYYSYVQRDAVTQENKQMAINCGLLKRYLIHLEVFDDKKQVFSLIASQESVSREFV